MKLFAESCFPFGGKLQEVKVACLIVNKSIHTSSEYTNQQVIYISYFHEIFAFGKFTHLYPLMLFTLNPLETVWLLLNLTRNPLRK